MLDVEVGKLLVREVVDVAPTKVVTEADARRERRAAAFRTMTGLLSAPARDGRG